MWCHLSSIKLLEGWLSRGKFFNVKKVLAPLWREVLVAVMELYACPLSFSV